MGIVTKPTINHIKDGEIITQVIREVHSNHLLVQSRSGKEYNVKLSDIVKMTMTPKVGDKAVIKTFQNGWLVTNILKKPVKKEVLSDEELKKQLEKEAEELLDMGYNY